MEVLKQKYESEHIEIQTDFTSNNPIMEADMLITDWSGISFEYAFTTYRPILFIDTANEGHEPGVPENCYRTDSGVLEGQAWEKSETGSVISCA